MSRGEGGEGVTIGHGLVSLEKQTRQVDKAGLVLRKRQLDVAGLVLSETIGQA